MLELDVTINEEIRAARPIKLEDRVKYMTEKILCWPSCAGRSTWR